MLNLYLFFLYKMILGTVCCHNISLPFFLEVYFASRRYCDFNGDEIVYPKDIIILKKTRNER